MQCMQLIDASIWLLFHVVSYFYILSVSDGVCQDPHHYMGYKCIAVVGSSDTSCHCRDNFGMLAIVQGIYGCATIRNMIVSTIIQRILQSASLFGQTNIYTNIGNIDVSASVGVSWNCANIRISTNIGNVFVFAIISSMWDLCQNWEFVLSLS